MLSKHSRRKQMAIDVLQYLPLLHAANEQEIGVRVMTNEPKTLQNLLYEARREARDPALSGLIIFAPASNDRIFIAKKSAELDD